MNGLQLLDIMRETENKMMHLHKTIDRVSNEPDFKESVSVLTEVVKDYQEQLEKVKSALGGFELNSNNQHQSNNNQHQSNNNQHQSNNNQQSRQQKNLK